jgi:hypothetical protein
MTPDLMEALEALDGKLSKKFMAYDDALTRIQQKMGGGGDLMHAGNGKQTLGTAVTKADAFTAFANKQSRT